MQYRKATEKQAEEIFELVQCTIQTIYPKYYPKEVVDFFCELHSKDNIARDIKRGLVGALVIQDTIVGTGCYDENHITRVYVSPECQGQGYGSYIMECLEQEIALQHDKVCLDASLPASHLYEMRGYQTVEHAKWNVENDVVLVYEIMEKELVKVDTEISYDGRYFVPQVNTENGEVDGQTVFAYHQKGNVLWAEYAGGEIRKGHLIGTVATNGELDFHYQHINVQGQVRVGKCYSIPTVREDGRIELAEEWQWLNGDKSKGKSVIMEVTIENATKS